MSKVLSVVIVGFGRVGKNYARLIRANKKFNLLGLIDPQEALDYRHWKNFDDFTQSKFVEKVDAFINCTPVERHYETTLELLKLEKPILIEKPITERVDTALKISKSATSCGVPIFVSKPERFNPAIKKLKNILEMGWVGQPIHYSINRVGGYPSDHEKGRSVVLDLAVNDFDLLQWLHGDFKVRSSICHQTLRHDMVDAAEILLLNEMGISASVHVNWITPVKIRKLKLTGTKGVLFIDYILQTCELFGGNFSMRQTPEEISFKSVHSNYKATDKVSFGISKSEPLMNQLNAFHDSICGQVTDLCTASEASSLVRLTKMAIEMGGGGRTLLAREIL